METFAYVMAGIMVATVIIARFCKHKYETNIILAVEHDYGFMSKALAWDFGYMICCYGVVAEVMFLFIVAIWCGISKLF